MTLSVRLLIALMASSVLTHSGSRAQADEAALATADLAVIEQCIHATLVGRRGASCIGKVSGPCVDTQDGSTTLGMNACYDRERAAWDALLNRFYKDLGSKLTDEGCIDLRDTQRIWLSFRQKSCSWPRYVYPGGSLIGPLTSECWQTQTARRALDLYEFRNRLNEM